ncbi:MAG: RNA-binding protein [Clostridia bacterium]|nr:RNA-binding protein [Clostridia bacterium]
MLELGKKQTLVIVRRVEFGAYLAESKESEEVVLLPFKQVPPEKMPGDQIEVFLYKDSKDRLIATTHEPKLMIGQVAVLEVVQVSEIGAFLDWGLEKDLFLPYKQQTKRVKKGEQCLVSLYSDKSERLCATMNVYEYMDPHVPYGVGDKIHGRVYQTSDQFGIFVAIDDQYSALIPKKECYGKLPVPGDIIEARITAIKEDGRADLSIRDKIPDQMKEDSEVILEAIRQSSGTLPFNDKADPQLIKQELSMSKAAFKRAVGRLLKQGQIEITDKGIQLRKK